MGNTTDIQRAFDYESLDSETRIVVQQTTREIRERARRAVHDVIEIGHRLIEVKERLGHGQFGVWLEVEFGWTDRTARNYMAVADAFKSETVSDLAISTRALYALASPSVSEEVRQEAIDRARDGEIITHAVANGIKEKHRPSPPPPTPRPSPVQAVPPKPEPPVSVVHHKPGTSTNGHAPIPVGDDEEDQEEPEEVETVNPDNPPIPDEDDPSPRFHLSTEDTAPPGFSKLWKYISSFLRSLPRLGGIAKVMEDCSEHTLSGSYWEFRQLRDVIDQSIRELEEAHPWLRQTDE